MRRYLIVWGLGVGLLVVMGGCQPKKVEAPKPQPDTTVQFDAMVGKYRLKMTEEEIEQIGGVEKVPTLFLNGEGKYNLTNEGSVLKGSYMYREGMVTLQDVDENEPPEIFVIQEGGKLLVEDTAENPLTWEKVETQ